IAFFFSSRRRHTRSKRDWSSDVCSSDLKRRCLYCDMLRQEIGAQGRVARLTPGFAALVPYAARSPLETWFLPRRHGCSFEDALTADTAADLARLVSQYFRTLAASFGDPGYELVLHTAPNLR